MKGLIRVILSGFLLLIILSGCSKQPSKEISEAKSAVEAALATGAQSASIEERQKLTDSLNLALNEVKLQDGKLIKKYTRARELLVKVKADADKYTMEENRKHAQSALETASAAVEDTKYRFSRFPRKGHKADYEAIDADIRALDDSLADANKSFEAKDYPATIAGAEAAGEQAGMIAERLNREKSDKAVVKKKKNGRHKKELLPYSPVNPRN